MINARRKLFVGSIESRPIRKIHESDLVAGAGLNPDGACFYLDSRRVPGYVHANINALLRLWMRISRKVTSKPQQMELNLWTRRQIR